MRPSVAVVWEGNASCSCDSFLVSAGDEPCEDGLEVSATGLCISGKKLTFGFKK